jgi:transcriptional regulator with PAS, ATPase and Fis domain
LDRKFREDLFYRINVIPLQLPPLRERGPDIAILAGHFLTKFNKLKKKNITRISPEAMRCFMGYPWPGNVRELENLIEMLVVMKEEGREIAVSDLPPKLLQHNHAASIPAALTLTAEGLDFNEMVSRLEKNLLVQALRKSHGVKNRAAKLLNLNRTTLVEKLKRFNLMEWNEATPDGS